MPRKRLAAFMRSMSWLKACACSRGIWLRQPGSSGLPSFHASRTRTARSCAVRTGERRERRESRLTVVAPFLRPWLRVSPGRSAFARSLAADEALDVLDQFLVVEA